jgi:dihydrofolate synthase/folylpolyglutamate synthase
MKFFLYQKCDIVILEVGMGGELDSTNVIDTPEAAVITAIGLDHTRELGETLPEIALAKAGIIKEDGDVVIYGGDEAVEAVFERTCREKNARLIRTDFSRLKIRSLDLESCSFDFLPYRDIRLPLIGTYQPFNAAVAITVLELLRKKGYRISDEQIIKGLGNVRWKGRFEVLRRNPVFILDGAHNPHGIEATAKSLSDHFHGKKTVFLIGVMADKDISGMLRLIAPMAKSFVAVRRPIRAPWRRKRWPIF